MVRLTLDFWALDIRSELYWLESYLDILEDHLESLPLHPPTDVEAALNDPEEEIRDPARQAWEHLTEAVAPRLSRGAFVVTLYAAYESGVIELAESVRRRRVNAPLALADIAGRSFLDRSKKYFDQVLGIPLCPDQGHWSTLGELAQVRHMFAHANGRTNGLRKRSMGTLRTLVQRDEALEVWDSIVILKPYPHRALAAVSASLRDLIERTKTPRLPPMEHASQPAESSGK
jgi:hypothetical protein